MKNKKIIVLSTVLFIGAGALVYFGLDAAKNHFWAKPIDTEVRPGQQYYGVIEEWGQEKKLRKEKGRILDLSGFPYWEVENMTDRNVKVKSDDDSEKISAKKPKRKRGKTVKLYRKNSLALTVKVGGQSKDFADRQKHYVRIIGTNPIEIETYDQWPETE